MAESCVREPKNRLPLGPYSRPHSLAKLDGRRREAKLMQETIRELTEHVGGSPSVVQRRLIQRAAVLALRLAMMDAKAPDGSLSEKDAREYLCWNNAYIRTLSTLGIVSVPKPQPSVRERLAEIHARAAGRLGDEA